MEREQDIKRVLWQILWLNVLVATGKVVWGTISNSSAMLADGIHSFTDGSSNIVALVAMKFAGKPLDDNHPYGHHKYESFASAIIGLMLVGAAYRVASGSVEKLWSYFRVGTLPKVEVTITSFLIMGITLLINIFVVWFEMKRGKNLNSDVLQSDAKHTLSDIWVTVGVIISLVLVKMGIALADPVVGLFVSFAILWAAWQVFRGVNTTFSDEARLNPLQVCDFVLAFPGVLGCHNIRTRGTGAIVHMDLSILVEPNITVLEGHTIAHDLEETLCREFKGLQDVVIHVEPNSREQQERPFLAQKKI